MGRYEEDDYEDEVEGEDIDDDEEYDEEEDIGSRKKKPRKRSHFIDDVAEEDEDEEDGDDNPRRKKRKRASALVDDIADVASDDDEEEEEGEDDFIIEEGNDLPEEEDTRMHRRPFLPRDEQDEQDIDDLEKMLQQRYSARADHIEYDEETTEVEQQALLPSIKDPKLWMVRCAIGREREAAVCLMQKFLDFQTQGIDLQIRSAIALDHLKGYLYVEADREAHVREACKGLRNIFSSKISLVPIKEMTDVVSVESKTVDLSKDTWVRVKIGTYKGDLAKVMDVDNVRQRVTIKLVPRIDLQALANKLEGKDVGRKKAFVPPPRFMNMREVKDMRIPVERKRDPVTKEVFETVDGMMFKDGYIYKTVSLKSISSQNIQPSFDELQKFQRPGDESDDAAGLSTLLANRKKGHFMKGDSVIVVRGDLKNLKGRVEKVEEDTVLIKPELAGFQEALSFKEKDLCKNFKPGDHVKVVSGTHQGATGMVVSVDRHVLVIVSDTTKENIKVFADNVVESSEVTSGITKLGDYELHDLVELDHMNFGVIIRVESDGCQILKGIPERAQVLTVKLRDMRRKLFDRNYKVHDKYRNTIALKDVVKIVEGAFKGKQGPIEHMHKGIIFIHDRHHLENGGFICAHAHYCAAVGGSYGGADKDNSGALMSRFASMRPPSGAPLSNARRPPRGGPPMSDGGGRGRGGRGRDQALIGKFVKIRVGAFKGYKGRVVDVNGQSVRIELESQMKVVTVNRDHLADVDNNALGRESPRYGAGSETPMHPSRTPMHPYMTPMRDPSATPIHDGMRTPKRDHAWNPYATMTPMRNSSSWEEGNPGSWGSSSPQYQASSPPSRPYEAPTPGSGWANTPSGAYSEAGTPHDTTYANAPSPYLPSTPGGPMTPSAPSYLPSTPGGQPLTPGTGGMDIMSPAIGGQEGGLLPGIVVNFRRSGEDAEVAVLKEVQMDGTCVLSLGQSSDGEQVTATTSEIEVLAPKKQDHIKILSGEYRGFTGRLLGIDSTDGIVKLDENLEIKILDMSTLAKLALQSHA